MKLDDENYIYPEVEEGSGDFIGEESSGFEHDLRTHDEDYSYRDPILVDSSSSSNPMTSTTVISIIEAAALIQASL